MIFHGLIESRIVKTADGVQHRQNRFHCHVHGWLDLVNFPDAESRHELCNQIIEPTAVGLEIPKTFAKAA